MSCNDQKLDDNDHRAIADRMDLFHFQPEAPGMVFWHPRGWRIFRHLEEAARRHVERQGYEEIRSPQLMRRPIWEKSGHWEHFAEAMFQLEEAPGRPSAIKPVSCPGHIQVLNKRLQSYRDLPIRLAEFGLVHRNERSGSLRGLFRLRQFVQDDGHIFCRPEDAVGEVADFCRGMADFYDAFEIEADGVALSLRPDGRLDDEARWDRAESILRQGAERAGLAVEEHAGEGAFYGPKIEWLIEDHEGRPWQAGTIQLDLFMPERFGVEYADANDELQRPIMLHRALYGCPERFMGLLLERHEGQLPVWLAPEQAAILPIGGEHADYAAEVGDALLAAGVEAQVDAADQSVGRRIAGAHQRGVSFMLLVGDREVDARSVAVRQGDDQSEMSFERGVEMIAEEASPPI
jgi:threonyl-tRNA synthetase